MTRLEARKLLVLLSVCADCVARADLPEQLSRQALDDDGPIYLPDLDELVLQAKLLEETRAAGGEYKADSASLQVFGVDEEESLTALVSTPHARRLATAQELSALPPLVLAPDALQGNVSRVAFGARGLQSAGGAGSGASICKLSDYQDAYDYEVQNGLFRYQLSCQTLLRQSAMLQFFPPTAWEVFHALCKGPCREFYARAKRLTAMEGRTNCTCVATQTRCPQLPNDMLCLGTGICYESEWYQENVCAATACGRWATNEASYRAARTACGMSLDPSPASRSAVAALAVAGAVLASAATFVLGGSAG